MSTLSLPLPAPEQRKRTSSFSEPRPAKTQRMAQASQPFPSIAMALSAAASTTATATATATTKTTNLRRPPLRRSETMLSIPSSSSACDAAPEPTATPPPLPTQAAQVIRTLQYHKEQRLKRQAMLARAPTAEATTAETAVVNRPTITLTPAPATAHKATRPPAALRPRRCSPPTPTPNASTSASSSLLLAPASKPKPRRAPTQVILPSASSPITTLCIARTSSPLAPTTTPRAARPVFPRAKAAPDLYRAALRAQMAASPEGRKVLLMGARLAVSIDAATRELERIVGEGDDWVMGDSTGKGDVEKAEPAQPVMTASWVVVRGEDWEMVDCAA